MTSGVTNDGDYDRRSSMAHHGRVTRNLTSACAAALGRTRAEGLWAPGAWVTAEGCKLSGHP
jgi:hypothetical protein